MASTPKSLVLYHYPYSPYARRVVWYLALRGIPYSECIQPVMMPRPDVAKLGINYRRIPILAIGRDVYLDTRLMIQKLEELYPEKPKLGGTSSAERTLEYLLQRFNVDSGVFGQAFKLLPTSLPLMQDPVYLKDRGEFIGGKLTKETAARGRPEAVNEMQGVFDFLEHTLLADGREWVLGTDGPRLADIEAIWPYHWLSAIPDALPSDIFSPTVYPKVYGWIARFQKAVSQAKNAHGRPVCISGDEAAKIVTTAPYNEGPCSVDTTDSVAAAEGLKGGDLVTLWPSDTGSSHKDEGRLLGLSRTEVVFEARARDDASTAVRVHAPRHGFRLRKASGGTATRL